MSKLATNRLSLFSVTSQVRILAGVYPRVQTEVYVGDYSQCSENLCVERNSSWHQIKQCDVGLQRQPAHNEAHRHEYNRSDDLRLDLEGLMICVSRWMLRVAAG